jgi:hypothetical protein
MTDENLERHYPSQGSKEIGENTKTGEGAYPQGSLSIQK